MPHPLLLVALLTLVGAITSAIGAWKVRDINSWPVVEATVLGHDVSLASAAQHRRERDNQERRYLARILLRAEINGTPIESDNSGFDGVPSFTTREDAESYVNRYSVGSSVTVRVSPRDPSIMHLGDNRLPWGRIGLSVFLLFASLASLGLYLNRS